MFTDKTLTCMDCGDEFVFTAKEQAFYAEKGFASEPRRCPSCRAKRKADRGDGGMPSRAPQGSRELHTVTCADCGTETQVPFRPSGNRPVYCRDCFRKHA